MPVTRGECRICGCSETEPCFHPVAQGFTCWWVNRDLCSFCAAMMIGLEQLALRNDMEAAPAELYSMYGGPIEIARAPFQVVSEVEADAFLRSYHANTAL